ncbi:MAG: adenylate/guanylate cyclase domain-containing protein [Rhodothermaceae bacterium]
MPMKNVTKNNLKDAGYIVLVFVVLAVFNFIGTYGTSNFPFGRAVFGSFVFSIFLILYEIVFNQKLLKKLNPLWKNLFNIFYIYVSFIILLTLLGYVTEVVKKGKSIEEAMKMTIPDMYPAGIEQMLINLFFIVTFMAVIYVAHKSLGPKVMRNLMFGKYSKPISEERIFMFLDLNSSTRIAEKLGHAKYSLFIKDFFATLDEAILETKGTIYQYVGDEVVLVWNEKTGKKKFNCLNFFFYAQKEIQEKSNYFWENYHVIPQFKAGLHFGEVSITEVGTFKKEIAYHGDPVNTTARICLQAKKLNSEFLISKEIYEIMPDANIYFDILPMGEQHLMGKDKLIDVYEVKQLKN